MVDRVDHHDLKARNQWSRQILAHHGSQAQWVSTLLAHKGSYGVVTHLSQTIGVARQTLYRWKEKGQAALEAAFTPATATAEPSDQLERAILTRLLEAHAS